MLHGVANARSNDLKLLGVSTFRALSKMSLTDVAPQFGQFQRDARDTPFNALAVTR